MANPGIWIPSNRYFSLSTTAFYSHLYLSFQFKLASCPEIKYAQVKQPSSLLWDLLNSTTLHVIRVTGKPDLKPICGYTHVLMGQVVTKPDENKLIEGYSRHFVPKCAVTGVHSGGITTLRY